MIKATNDFPKILESYFSKHLLSERSFSTNTYNTYLMVIKQYIKFLESKGISGRKISLNDFSKDNVLSFLLYVEEVLQCSAKTRNHKLAVINSFLEYAQSFNPAYLNIYMESKSIKLKRVVKDKMDFLTIDELESFFKVINIKQKTGYKHYVLLTILYETAARVSELINIKVSDLYFNANTPYIKIIGKGNKERIVYINDSVKNMIVDYMSKMNITRGYLLLSNSKSQYSRYGVNKLIDKYAVKAKKECPTMRNKTITPHTFRHSKAVHLLQKGTALPIIQRFLGHSSIQTTEIYLDITNEVVIEAVKTAANIISRKETSLWANDDKLIELLESIK